MLLKTDKEIKQRSFTFDGKKVLLQPLGERITTGRISEPIEVIKDILKKEGTKAHPGEFYTLTTAIWCDAVRSVEEKSFMKMALLDLCSLKANLRFIHGAKFSAMKGIS